MEIRFAKKEDLPSIVALARAMADVHHEIDPYYKPGAAHKTLADDFANLLNDHDTILVVAEINKKIIGYINMSVETIEYISAKKIGVINNAYIIPAHRRQGIAKALFTLAEYWLHNKKKVEWIELNADARNKNAVELWSKLGFETYKLRMRKKLSH